VHTAPKSLGTLANDQPRSKMSERGVHFHAGTGGQERTRWAIEGAAKADGRAPVSRARGERAPRQGRESGTSLAGAKGSSYRPKSVRLLEPHHPGRPRSS